MVRNIPISSLPPSKHAIPTEETCRANTCSTLYLFLNRLRGPLKICSPSVQRGGSSTISFVPQIMHCDPDVLAVQENCGETSCAETSSNNFQTCKPTGLCVRVSLFKQRPSRLSNYDNRFCIRCRVVLSPLFAWIAHCLDRNSVDRCCQCWPIMSGWPSIHLRIIVLSDKLIWPRTQIL